jgi:hypothetical protein
VEAGGVRTATALQCIVIFPSFLSLLDLRICFNPKLLLKKTTFLKHQGTFHGEIIPILKAFGKSSLESISLSHFLDLDFHVLIQICPNLVVLDLVDNLSQIDGCWAKCNPQILMQLGKL